jgi:trk system potassium uptake protein TrkH
MRKRDLAVVARLVADFLYFFGYLLLIPATIGLVVAEYREALVFGVGAVVIIPTFWVLRRRTSVGEVERRHAAITLAVVWTLFSLLSSLPFAVYGLDWIDALFESFSAWTDTGLTMIPHPGELPYSLSTFRILMQWVSGLGIVLFLLCVQGPSPRAARSLFAAEGRFEDFTTNLWQVGRTVVLIYVGYTVLGFVAFLILGIPPFHALMHAASSLSTGGFSTNSVGVGLYGMLPSAVAMTLMLCGGISFSSHQALVTGNLKKFFRNPEIRVLFAVILVASALLFAEQLFFGEQPVGADSAGSRYGQRLFDSVYYVISSISTCGAGTVLSLSQVPAVFRFTVFLLMISGAVYGSTTGALKLWRLIIIGKVIGREIRLPFYPTGTAMPIRMGSNLIAESTALQVGAYALLYLAIGLLGSLVFMLFGYGSLDALFTVFSAQGNVGLNAMPDALYYGMHPALKGQLILHMLIGRMEILPLLHLLHGMRDLIDR